MRPELAPPRGHLLFSALLHTGTLLALALGINLLPLADDVQAVPPALPGMLQHHALATRPVQLALMGGDASGITWNDSTGTLFAVRNNKPQVIELDRDGQVFRSIALHGFMDVEGITWLQDNRFAVVEERDCSVWLLDIARDVTEAHKPPQPLFALPALNVSQGNQGCEDLAWNPGEQVFYLAKEKSPAMLLRISGIDPVAGTAQPVVVTSMVNMVSVDAVVGLFGSDLSGLHFDRESGQLLVLSEESRRITGIGTAANLSALAPSFELGWWRNGLGVPVPQPEGITLSRDGTLYVLSEPNLLYLFTR